MNSRIQIYGQTNFQKLFFLSLLLATLFATNASAQTKQETVNYTNTLNLLRRATLSDSNEVNEALQKIQPFIINNSEKKARLWNRMGDYFYRCGNPKKAISFYDKSEKLADQLHLENLINSNQIKKVIVTQQKDLQKAENEFLRFLTIVQQNHDYENEVLCYNSLGLIYENRTNSNRSISFMLKALGAAEKADDPYLIAMVLNNLGLIKMNHHQYNSGLKDLKRGLTYASKFHAPILEFYLLNNIGIIYNEQKDYKKSIEYYTQTLNKALEMKYSNLIGTSYYNLSKSYLLSNNLENAFRLADSSFVYLQKDFDSMRMAKPILIQAHIYLQRKDFPKALDETDHALNLLHGISISEDKSEAFLLKSKIFEEQNDYKKSLFFYKQYSAMNDSIAQQNNLEELTKLQLNFDLQQKDAEVLRLQAQNQKKEARNILIISISSFIILGLILFFYLRQDRIKRREKAIYAQRLIESIDKERVRISRDLHDDMGQYLSILKSKVNAVKKGNPQYLDEIEDDLGLLVEKVRVISHALHPSHLEKIGLSRAVVSLLNEVEKATPLITDYEIYDQLDDNLNLEEKNHIYRILQECINNTVKHANAKSIKITFDKDAANNLIIEYRDNGHPLKTENPDKGIGLQTIAERTLAIKGRLFFDFLLDGGFLLRIKKQIEPSA